MKVLLAGATGTIGTALVPRLLAAGHQVLGLTRSHSGAQRLTEAGAQPVLADMMDAGCLPAALGGHTADAVIHQATAISGPPAFHRNLYATDALRQQGTTHLLDAAARIGAHRFITQSFFLGYGFRDHGTAPVTEDRAFAVATGHRATDRHMRSLASNEEQVFSAPGIDGIALRYGMFYGPEHMTRQLADLARRRLLPIPRPCGVVSAVHIHDAASAAVAALDHGRAGQAYNIADDRPVEFGEYITTLAGATGAPAPLTVPGWVLRATPYLHGLMVDSRIRLSNAKAKDELGWKPIYPSIEEGMRTL